jgi:hypothetical protein
MAKLLPPGLHVLLGDAAGGIFTRVFFARDRLLIDQDVLSCGPTPPCTDLEAWSKLRGDFWTHLAPSEDDEQVPSRFNLVANAKRLADAERVHIWAATGVSEQLFIAFVVHLMQLVGGDLARLALVQFELSNKRRVIGLGELDEAQMRAAPEPGEMSADTARQYLDAWAAITSPDPALLAGFARLHPGASNWLKIAIRLMSRRYPDKATGLTYWDHALLSRVYSKGPAASQIIGYTMAETFDHGDLVGDWYLFGRLLRLGSARNAQPLVQIKGDLRSLRNAEVKLTTFGTEVLSGATSNYPTNAIDDWAGGVRLSSAEGRVWFNDGGQLVRAPA